MISRRELKLVLSAQAQTSGAFNQVAGELQSLHKELDGFNDGGLNQTQVLAHAVGGLGRSSSGAVQGSPAVTAARSMPYVSSSRPG